MRNGSMAAWEAVVEMAPARSGKVVQKAAVAVEVAREVVTLAAKMAVVEATKEE